MDCWFCVLWFVVRCRVLSFVVFVVTILFWLLVFVACWRSLFVDCCCLLLCVVCCCLFAVVVWLLLLFGVAFCVVVGCCCLFRLFVLFGVVV